VRFIHVLSAIVAVWLSQPFVASAQSDSARSAIEVSAARGAFLDDAPIEHAVIGAAARWYVSSRLSVGPEVTYAVGPGSDRDLFVTGNLTTDLRRARGSRRVVPYVLIGAGLMRHSDRFSGRTYASSEWAVTAGGGVRIAATRRLWFAPEVRVGWEPHVRVGVTIGYRLDGRTRSTVGR
jgi:hypothetical protein